MKPFRGQAWGVMEVLVSVIILAMSMAIVFYVLQNVQSTQCVSELKSQTLSMQNALLDVALGSPPTTRRVFYKMPECGGKSVEAMRFSYYAEPAYCKACPGAYGGCWLIEPMVYDYKNEKLFRLVDAVTCVNMPADIELTMDDSIAGKCLTDHMSTNFCPRIKPGQNANITPSGCSKNSGAGYAGVLEQLYYGPGQNPPEIGATSQNRAHTLMFTKKASEKTFMFEFIKQGGSGFQSTVLVCPCANANCRPLP